MSGDTGPAVQAFAGTIFDIKRFAVHDGPGIRTTVFFKGCPLTCPWCHNPEGIKPSIESVQTVTIMDGKRYHRESVIGRSISAAKLLEEIEKERIIIEESGGGVTFSGGEPLFQPEFLLAMLTACNDRGIHTTIDTSGFAADSVMKKVIPLTGLFLFDLKTLKPELSVSETGAPLARILNSFKLIVNRGVRLRLRIPVIPGFNFDEENLALYLEFIAKHRESIEGVHLLPFHAIAAHKYARIGKPNSLRGRPSLLAHELGGWVSGISALGVSVMPEG